MSILARMSLSRSFPVVFIMLIGLYLKGSEGGFSEPLYRRTSLADFQAVGKTPVLRVVLKGFRMTLGAVSTML